MTIDSNILDTLLNAVANACIGNGSIEGYARSLFGYLITIDFVLAILFNLLSFGGAPILSTLITKIMKYGFWIWLISNWGTIVNGFINSLNIAGMSLGSTGPEMLKYPSKIIDLGIEMAFPFFDYLTSFTSWTSIVGSAAVYLFAFIGGIGVVTGFTIIAFQVFITYVEFYICSALMLLFLPFGSNKFTARFAENALGGVIAHGVKLMFLGAILSITAPVLDSINIEFSTTPTWDGIFSATIAPWALAFLSWQAPAMAAGFMSGGPSLTASLMASNAAGAGSSGATATSASVSATRSAAMGTFKAGAGLYGMGKMAGNAAKNAYSRFGGGSGSSGGMGNFNGLPPGTGK